MGTVKGAALGTPGGAPVATGPRTCIRSFRASPDQVREARRFLAQVLGDCPTAPDAVACLSELVTNSVLYSNSRRAKGRFIVRACPRPAGLRVEVEDEGGPWEHRQGGTTTSVAAAWPSSRPWRPAGRYPATEPAAPSGSRSAGTPSSRPGGPGRSPSR